VAVGSVSRPGRLPAGLRWARCASVRLAEATSAPPAGRATWGRTATARSGPAPGATSSSPAARAANWPGSPRPVHRLTAPGSRLRA